jgi:hypothetical protein
MFAKLTLTACMLVFMLPVNGLAKKPFGDILDRPALAHVQTYCIDASQLSDTDRYVLNGFLKNESKPKHLLTKLPWKLMRSCQDDNPDAIVTLDFVSLTTIENTTGGPTTPPLSVTDRRDPEAEFKAVMTVADSSPKSLYQVEARPMASTPAVEDQNPTPSAPPMHGGPAEKTDAIYHVFWRLINDLQILHGEAAS